VLIIRCDRCRQRVSDSDKTCPLCGAKIKIKRRLRSLIANTAPLVLWLSLVANLAQYIITDLEKEKHQIAEAARIADMSGAQTFVEACTICHRKDNRPLKNLHLTKEQWKEAIERMEDYRRGVAEAKRPALVDYLVAMTSAAPGPTLWDYLVAMTSAAPGPAKQ
jgi:hypothetical protein